MSAIPKLGRETEAKFYFQNSHLTVNTFKLPLKCISLPNKLKELTSIIFKTCLILLPFPGDQMSPFFSWSLKWQSQYLYTFLIYLCNMYYYLSKHTTYNILLFFSALTLYQKISSMKVGICLISSPLYS